MAPTTTVAQNKPGRVELNTICLQFPLNGNSTLAFTVKDDDGLKSVLISPETLTLKGSLSTGQYTASPIARSDAGKTLTVNVVDGKGVPGSYKVIVPAPCG